VLSCIVHFYSIVKDLAADTDTFEVPDEFIEYVIKRAKIDIFSRQKLLQNKDEALAALDKEIKDQFASYQVSMQGDNESSKQIELS